MEGRSERDLSSGFCVFLFPDREICLAKAVISDAEFTFVTVLGRQGAVGASRRGSGAELLVLGRWLGRLLGVFGVDFRSLGIWKKYSFMLRKSYIS